MHVFRISTAYHGNDLIDKGEKMYQFIQLLRPTRLLPSPGQARLQCQMYLERPP